MYRNICSLSLSHISISFCFECKNTIVLVLNEYKSLTTANAIIDRNEQKSKVGGGREKQICNPLNEMHKKQTSQQNYKIQKLVHFILCWCLFICCVFLQFSLFLGFSFSSSLNLSLNKRKQYWFHAQTLIFVAKFQSNHSVNDLKFTLRYDNRRAYRTQYNAFICVEIYSGT